MRFVWVVVKRIMLMTAGRACVLVKISGEEDSKKKLMWTNGQWIRDDWRTMLV